VKIYRYKIQEGKFERLRQIQEKANRIYARYFSDSAEIVLRNRENPNSILEISWYPDEETYRRGIERVDTEPEILILFEELKTLLVKGSKIIQEEYNQAHEAGLIFSSMKNLDS
jgi:hypothetical protein